MPSPSLKHPATPDGRYFIVRGRLWPMANPNLKEARRAELADGCPADDTGGEEGCRPRGGTRRAYRRGRSKAGARRARPGVVGRWRAGSEPAHGLGTLFTWIGFLSLRVPMVKEP